MNTKTRPAVVGDKLVTTNFGSTTTGFAAADDAETAVCLLPGTELAFDRQPHTSSWIRATTMGSSTAIFRQVNKEHERMHHDMLEFADGETTMLTYLAVGQLATVLQLPAAPKTAEEAKEQERVAVVA